MDKGKVTPGKGINMSKGTEMGSYKLCSLLGKETDFMYTLSSWTSFFMDELANSIMQFRGKT